VIVAITPSAEGRLSRFRQYGEPYLDVALAARRVSWRLASVEVHSLLECCQLENGND
jgi:hypothetical protein